MKRWTAFIFCSIVCVASYLASAEAAEDWKEIKGDHFIVYSQGKDDFAKSVLRQSEIYYTRIASDLGYARYSNFWQWDNRVKIYIYPDKQSYTKATSQPEWSEGVAYYQEKKIVTYEWSEQFLDALLPHEITHLIFRDFVGFKGQIPLWLDEGVAQWEEIKKREVSKFYARQIIRKLQWFPLRQLTIMRDLSGESEETVNAFYMQAVSVVDFLIATYGGLSFTNFCRELRDGKTISEALRATYPGRISNIDELEKLWLDYVEKD